MDINFIKQRVQYLVGVAQGLLASSQSTNGVADSLLAGVQKAGADVMTELDECGGPATGGNDEQSGP